MEVFLERRDSGPLVSGDLAILGVRAEENPEGA
jgi:hypothetical protein